MFIYFLRLRIACGMDSQCLPDSLITFFSQIENEDIFCTSISLKHGFACDLIDHFLKD